MLSTEMPLKVVTVNLEVSSHAIVVVFDIVLHFMLSARPFSYSHVKLLTGIGPLPRHRFLLHKR